ncbi:MAG TPA: PEGA domain-containing protein [Steroidobacteraceae bacterium]
MTDPVRTTNAYTQVRIREPLGERILGEALTVGGQGADVLVPGADAKLVVQILRSRGVWVVLPVSGIARFNGRLLGKPTDLRRHDVIAIADAQVIVTGISRTLLCLDVCHLQGNTTIAPANTLSPIVLEDGDDELEIEAPPEPAPVSVGNRRRRTPRWAGFGEVAAALAIALLIVLGIYSQLIPVALDIQPGNARISAPADLLAMHLGSRLFLLPGHHRIRAESQGYVPAQADLLLRRGVPSSVRLRLVKLPGELDIDTAGIACAVSVDGAEVGRAPGTITVPAGQHTLLLRAPRHVDFIATLQIEGAGDHQRLTAVLQPSWGTLQITSLPPGASVLVDGVAAGTTPIVVDAPAGVRRVRISSPGLKPWESSVVLNAGEALTLGPIMLGQPDAHLSLSSRPAAAAVMIGGTFRGHTPLEADLPAGIQQDLTLSLPGYAPWSRRLDAAAGKRLTVHATLEPVGARVSVQGEPADAELLIDGVLRGHTPQRLVLAALEHHLEVRKRGWLPFSATVTPAAGLDRVIHYQLTSAELAASRAQRASVLYTQTGYRMRLVTAPTVPATAARSSGDRRSVVSMRRSVLDRSFYLGAMPVTNEQFRRFRPDHRSVLSGPRETDRDDAPVIRVSWPEAVEFCNWLSEQDSLPPAYARSGGTYVLLRPVTIGYRLPTQAEWQYATREAASQRPAPFADLPGKSSEWLNDGAAADHPTFGFRVARYAE